MEQKEQETPEIPIAEAEEPTGDVTLESGAEGVDLASTARSPELETPAPGESGPVGDGEAIELLDQGVTEAEPAVAAAQPAPGAPKARPYRPTDDYVEGDRIHHAVWDATGVVKQRDPREQVFRVSVGGVDEPGRCHLIRVEFEKEVPASGGAKREVLLIADWHGRALEPGSTGGLRPTAAGTLMGLGEAAEERPAAPRARVPALPEIPEPEEALDEEEEEESTEEEEIEPVGI